MKITEANKILEQCLNNHYDNSEVKQIQRIFWEDLFAYNGGIDRTLHTREINIFQDALEKFKDSWPVQYVTGVSYFYNLKFKVDKNVLIPRPETEELVHAIIVENKKEHALNILEIGTGSGCISVVLKNKLPSSNITAIDISTEALEVSQLNAERNETKINFQQFDFLDKSSWHQYQNFDIIVSNPPYISRSEKDKMSTSTLAHEPEIALFPLSEDVLIFYKRIAEFGVEHLEKEGKVYVECNEFNALEVENIFRSLEYPRVALEKDMQGKQRILSASF